MAKKPLSLDDLPDEVREVIEPHVVDLDAVLSEIGSVIAARRAEAKAARQSSGIEEIWKQCEEAYLGVDEANRAEFTGARWSKPMSMDGPVQTGARVPNTENRSTAFVGLTARYVDAADAKLSEILLPPDDKSFSFDALPDPELLEALDDKSQVVHDGMGNVPLTRAAKPGEAVAAPAQPTPSPPPTPGASGTTPQAPQVPLTVADLATEKLEQLRKKAKAAEDRVYRWLLECRYRPEMRKVIHDAARIGVGVVKGPVPMTSKGVGVHKSGSGTGIEIEVKEKISPAAKWVDPWNVYPDPACGENIGDGDYLFEADHLSERQVRKLKRTPGYINKQIDAILKEGPNKAYLAADDGNKDKTPAETKGRYEIWYYYGSISARELDAIERAAGKPRKGALDEAGHDAYVIVTMINDRVIRAVINPLDSGEIPYHAMPWRRRSGYWAGVGVAEQLFVAQKMLNAATRAMLNNAGLSAGAQIVINQNAIKPADGKWALVPNKIWLLKPGDDVAEATVQNCFGLHEIPNTVEEMMTVINYALKLAEESTSIPLITQGQTGPTTPETLGATQLQDSNANQLLRSVGYAFDDYVTEPLVQQFYEWLLLDPDVPDEEKGEFKIDAHGSVVLVERAIQDQTLIQIGNWANNPNNPFGIDPRKWFKQMAKSKRLNPEDLQFSKEEQDKRDEAPPPVAPAVQVAQINAQSRQATTQATLQAKGQSDQVKAGVDEKKIATDATIELHDQATRRDLLILQYALEHRLTVEQVKADLAQTAMKLNVERELNAQDNAADAHKNRRQPRPQRQPMRPPVQTPGRAGNGRAFEQGAPQ
jgi:hypothetical protein